MRANEREFEVHEDVGPVPAGSVVIFDDADGSIHLLVRLTALEAARIMTEGNVTPAGSRHDAPGADLEIRAAHLTVIEGGAPTS